MRKPVLAREETFVIPTCLVPLPEQFPVFLEKRINQGLSGRVHPQPLIDTTFSTASTSSSWR